MPRAKFLTEDDLRVWAAYSRTLRLLPGKARIVEPPPPPGAVAGPVDPARPAVPDRPGARALVVDAQPPGLDRASWRKLRVGQIRPERSLDLHGLTAAHAHRAVTAFLQQAHAQRRRCVEIITGKGEVLARELPLWLEAPPLRQLILALVHPHAANAGAIRVLLRRAGT